MSFLARLRDRLFEILVVAAPGDWLSRAVGILLAVLILINAGAQALEWLWPQPAWEPYLLWFERGSMVLFTLEFAARLWAGHADGAREDGSSRLGRLIHPLMLVDLAVLLAWAGIRWTQIDLRALRLLRLPDMLFRFSRTLSAPGLGEEDRPFSDVQEASRNSLAEVRSTMSEAAQRDQADLRDRLAETAAAVRRVQQRWLLAARRDPDHGRSQVEATRERVNGLLQALEESLSPTVRLEQLRPAAQSAYDDSARVYDATPETTVDVRDLRWRDLHSCMRVPSRRIGQHHFAELATGWTPAFDGFSRVYGDGLRQGLEGVRSAIGYQFDLVQRGVVVTPAQLQSGFNRAINRCRDLSEPARTAWEELEWGLEAQHIDRLELVGNDVGRYGRIEFYLARVARGIGRQVAFGIDTGRGLVLRLGPALWLRLVAAYRDGRQLALPALEWIGLVRPAAEETREEAEQARLDSVLERGLAEDYLTHFQFAPLEDDSMLVGFDEELAQIDGAVGRWEGGQASSLLIQGPRGGGKTSLLNVARRRLFTEGAQVTRETVTGKITEPHELVTYLCRILQLAPSDDLDGLALALLAGPRRAIILEGCHNLYLRRIGGLGAIRQLLWLVARTNHHILWALCLDENARSYLAKWLPFGRMFHFEVDIEARTGPELRRLVMQRHNLSGYRLRYADGPRIRRALRRRVRGFRRVEEPAVQEALASMFFEDLAETCVDNTTAVLYYWLRALESAEGESCVVHPHDPITLDLVRDLSLDAAFVLAAILQHDNLTAEELAAVVDRGLIDTRLELEILWNDNVIECDQETQRFRINAVALKPVRTMLAGRNLA